ncbi:hypothetical protein EDD16DRAFT_1515244 [Pisolithus croceorrhizus]|nr:hypothetical protein EDD16DRAFT_1515244 [Pisolithus croceorrhizus]
MEASLITPDHPDSRLSGNSTSGSSSEAAEGSGASISQPKRSLAPIQDDPNSDEGDLEGIKAINSQEEATIRLAAASAWREVAKLSKKEVAAADHEIGYLRDAIQMKVSLRDSSSEAEAVQLLAIFCKALVVISAPSTSDLQRNNLNLKFFCGEIWLVKRVCGSVGSVGILLMWGIDCQEAPEPSGEGWGPINCNLH